MPPHFALELIEEICGHIPPHTREHRDALRKLAKVSPGYAHAARRVMYRTEELPASQDVLRGKLSKWKEGGPGEIAAAYVRDLKIHGGELWHQCIITHENLRDLFDVFQHVQVFTISACSWYGALGVVKMPQRCSLLRRLTLSKVRFTTATADLADIASQCDALRELRVWDCEWEYGTHSICDYSTAPPSRLQSLHVVPLRHTHVLGRLIAGAKRALNDVRVKLESCETCE